MSFKSKASLPQLLSTDCWDLRHRQVSERRHVLSVVISTVKLLGKQGLPMRGHRGEAAYTLENNTVNHGNFLEFIKEIAKYDDVLKRHIERVINVSKEKESRNASGRGSFVSFISPSTFNNIVKVIASFLQQRVVNEIKHAGMYAIMIDSTQDLSTHDQCCIVLRYVLGSAVNEKLLALINTSDDTSAEALFQIVDKITTTHNIPLQEMCIADSFDGASNMSAKYNGLQAHLKIKNPTHIHTWCYSHVLNLVMSDSCGSLESISFFNLLQSVYVFFSESYKRTAAWENTLVTRLGSTAVLRKLTNLGATRWRAKHNAVVKIFGTFNASHAIANNLFAPLIICLHEIAHSSSFSGKSRSDAMSLCSNLMKPETIFVAFIYLRIFQFTTPASDYLQTSGLDYLQAWRLIASATSSLEEISRDFNRVQCVAMDFITQTNIHLQKLDFDEEIPLTFQDKGIRRKKLTDGELAPDEVINSPIKRFEVQVHNVILDSIISSIKRRFASHSDLYQALEIFDPRNFNTLASLSSDNIALQLKGIQQVIPNIDILQLQSEIIHFAREWHH